MNEIDNCTVEDFNQIITDIEDFWGSSRTLHLHHPYLIYEFGNTAFVIREEGKVIAYLFGFYSQKENTAYIHLLGVRESYQRKGLGLLLYNHFIDIAKQNGMDKIKAITTSTNEKSINFHTKKVGMEMLGEPDGSGVPVIKDYSGPGKDRVVFSRNI